MAASFGYVLAQLQRWTSPHVAELSDAVLLEQFLQRRDESAFAALVARYGRMVLRSCHRVLGDVGEAEDAFQTTFLILARQAHTLRQPAALSGFLHGIARRVALKARRKATAGASQGHLPDQLLAARSDPLAQLTARELLTVLEEEVGRLPLAQRSAVVLCCLEGRTQEEAARRLGWTAGSLKGHLERGRRRLQERLRRRGIALSAALAIGTVSRGEAMSAMLLRNTVATALSGGTVSTLAQSVLQTMFLSKLAGMMALGLTVAFVASAALALVYRGLATEPPEDKPPSVSATGSTGTNKPQTRTDSYGDPLPDGALRRLGTLRFRYGGGINNLLLTPDGKTLLSHDVYGTQKICVWDLATGKLLRQFPGSFAQGHIALSADGKLVTTCQKDAIHLWDLASGKEVRRLAQAEATGVAFAPDGKILAAAGRHEIHQWDLASGKKSPNSPGNAAMLSAVSCLLILLMARP